MNEAADPIMLSALQHWSNCPRQCALIHVEQAIDENGLKTRFASIFNLFLFGAESVSHEPTVTFGCGCQKAREALI